MEKYMDLYTKDSRFTRYVDACMTQEKRPLVDMLRMKTIRLVGDYYIANPAKEEKPMVQKMTSGGC